MAKPNAPEVAHLDHTGCTYGSVTALRRMKHPVSRLTLWETWCSACERPRALSPSQMAFLRKGKARSCGCLADLGQSGAELNRVYRNYRGKARDDRFPFELTKEHAFALFGSCCHYCGVAPPVVSWDGYPAFRFNGIDRIDSNLGYVVGNVRTACTTCNRAKNDKTDAEFADWTRRFVGHQTRTPVPGVETQANPDVLLFWYNESA